MEDYENIATYGCVGDDIFLFKISSFYHYKLVPVFRYKTILERYNFVVCVHVLFS